MVSTGGRICLPCVSQLALAIHAGLRPTGANPACVIANDAEVISDYQAMGNLGELSGIGFSVSAESRMIGDLYDPLLNVKQHLIAAEAGVLNAGLDT